MDFEYKDLLSNMTNVVSQGKDCTELHRKLLRATEKNSGLATLYQIVTLSTLTCLCGHVVLSLHRVY